MSEDPSELVDRLTQFLVENSAMPDIKRKKKPKRAKNKPHWFDAECKKLKNKMNRADKELKKNCYSNDAKIKFFSAKKNSKPIVKNVNLMLG